MKKRQGHPFSIVIPLSAVVVTIMLVLGTRKDALRSELANQIPVATITVEHKKALTLHVNASSGKKEGIVEFTSEGTGTAALIVPAEWKRREVRGAGLGVTGYGLRVSGPASAPAPSSRLGTGSATAGKSDVGEERMRWKLPPNVTLSFWVGRSPALTVKNPSGVPLLVSAKKVDVETGRIEERNVLITDKEANVW